MKQRYNINNLDCANCARHLEEKLNSSNKLSDVSVNFSSGKISFNGNLSLDELNSLKQNNTLYDIYPDSIFFQYEIFVGHFMLMSFIKTQDIFNSFRSDEKRFISYINKNILI